MHHYATDSEERRIVPFLLAGCAVLIAYFIYWATAALHMSIPWWVDVPGPFLLYGVLYATFDEWVWRWHILRYARIVVIPDLNGRWVGILRSSFDNYEREHSIVLQIRQKWTRIVITTRGSTSRSHSTVAAIDMSGIEPVLNYQYVNEPLATAVAPMNTHRGTAWLVVKPLADGPALEGEYYTGRGRATIGQLRFVKGVIELHLAEPSNDG